MPTLASLTGLSKDAPQRVKTAFWLLTIAGLTVFVVLMGIDLRYYDGDHMALLCGIGIVIILVRVEVVAKWRH